MKPNFTLLLIFLLTAIIFLSGCMQSDSQNTFQEVPAPGNEDVDEMIVEDSAIPQRIQASVDDDPVKGSGNASVTIIEFGDFQCPFCANFYTQTLPLIKENYINTGKVKFVYRDFPLDISCNTSMNRQLHPNACKAAEAAECADNQGKFWEYHDKLFENQQSLDITSLKQYAEDLGLDAAEFNNCLDSGEMTSEVQNDINDALSYGVEGTPAFFINGIFVSGSQPFSVFQQIIEEELNN